MHLKTRLLSLEDSLAASNLDKHWFGDYGASEREIRDFITQTPENSLGIFAQDNELMGFATFEVLMHNLPKNYIGTADLLHKTLFVHQFTTTTNYSVSDSTMDKALLNALELKARELQCAQIWEALDTKHPYSALQNPAYDAFGFYHSHGYMVDQNAGLSWQSSTTVIPCYLFCKKMSLFD